MYDLYMQALRGRPVTTLRDLLDFNGPGRAREAIPLEQVEPAEKIMSRQVRLCRRQGGRDGDVFTHLAPPWPTILLEDNKSVGRLLRSYWSNDEAREIVFRARVFCY